MGSNTCHSYEPRLKKQPAELSQASLIPECTCGEMGDRDRRIQKLTNQIASYIVIKRPYLNTWLKGENSHLNTVPWSSHKRHSTFPTENSMQAWHEHEHTQIHVYKYTHVHIHTSTHRHTHVHIHMFNYMHVHTNIYIHTKAHTHTHTHIFIHTPYNPSFFVCNFSGTM